MRFVEPRPHLIIILALPPKLVRPQLLVRLGQLVRVIENAMPERHERGVGVVYPEGFRRLVERRRTRERLDQPVHRPLDVAENLPGEVTLTALIRDGVGNAPPPASF